MRKACLIKAFSKMRHPTEAELDALRQGYYWQTPCVCRCLVKKVCGEDVLCIAVYAKEAKNDVFVFCRKGGTYLSYSPHQKRWSKATVDRVANKCYEEACPSDYARNTARRFLGIRKRAGETVMSILRSWQKRIMDAKRFERHAAEAAVIDAAMEGFESLPGPCTDNEMIAYPLVYSRKGKMAYCTACGKDVPPGAFRHNAEGFCPKCGRKVAYKSSGYFHGRAFAKWSVDCRARDGRILVRYFRHTVAFRESASGKRKAAVEREELFRSVFDNAGGSGRFMVSDFYNTGNIRWCRYRNIWGVFMPSEWSLPKAVYVPKGAADELALVHGTSYVPGLLEDAFREGRYCKYFELDDLVYHAWVNPALEQVVKAGFTNLFWNTFNSYTGTHGVVEKGDATRLRDILGVTRLGQKRLLNIGNPTVGQLEAARRYNDAPDSLFDWVAKNGKAGELARRADDVKAIAAELKWGRLVPYLRRHCPNGNVSLFIDYHRMRKTLGQGDVFPRHLRAAHDAAVAEMNRRRDEFDRIEKERKDKLLKAAVERLLSNEAYTFSNDAYCIVIPECYEDFCKESKELAHCVRTYFDRVVENKTRIFFIRSVEARETPFFTLEIDNDGHIVQCRTRYNMQAKDYDEKHDTDVMGFAKAFAERIAA